MQTQLRLYIVTRSFQTELLLYIVFEIQPGISELWQVASWPNIVRIVSSVDVTTAINPDDIKSGIKVILPPSIIGRSRYLHKIFQNAIFIARQYHKPDFFITFTGNNQWPEVTHSLLSKQHLQDRTGIKFHWLPKLHEKSFMLAEPLLFITW